MKLFKLSTITSLSLLAAMSHAHFLWAEIRETPQRHVAIELAETPGDSVVGAVNGRSDRVKPMPSSLSYKLSGKEFGGNISSTDKVVGAAMDYGYFDRGEVPFKLCYFAKGVQKPEDAAVVINLPVELTATAKGNDLIITTWVKGKPYAGAEMTYHFPEIVDMKGKSDAKGNFTVPGAANKPVAVMALVAQNLKGTIDGKDYSLVKNYSTLVVGRFSEDVKGDKEAHDALKSAVDSREKFPEKLLGFQMDVNADVDGKLVTGSFTFDLGAGVTTKLEGDADAKKWVEGQIRSIVLHRSAGRFEDGDGSHEITFTGSENPLGKQVAVADSMKSSYRIKEGQILEVDRTMGPTRIVVSVLDSIDTTPGKKLATQMTVAAYDAASGALKSSDLITDSFVANDGVWLPTRRRVVTVEKSGTTIRTVSFKTPKLVLK